MGTVKKRTCKKHTKGWKITKKMNFFKKRSRCRKDKLRYGWKDENHQIAGGQPAAEMKGIIQKRENVFFNSILHSPLKGDVLFKFVVICQTYPVSVLALDITWLDDWMCFKICHPGFMLISLLAMSSQQEHSSECQRNLSVSLPSKMWQKKIPVLKLVLQCLPCRGSVETLLCACPLREMRDVTGS